MPSKNEAIDLAKKQVTGIAEFIKKRIPSFTDSPKKEEEASSSSTSFTQSPIEENSPTRHGGNYIPKRVEELEVNTNRPRSHTGESSQRRLPRKISDTGEYELEKYLPINTLHYEESKMNNVFNKKKRVPPTPPPAIFQHFPSGIPTERNEPGEAPQRSSTGSLIRKPVPQTPSQPTQPVASTSQTEIRKPSGSSLEQKPSDDSIDHIVPLPHPVTIPESTVRPIKRTKGYHFFDKPRVYLKPTVIYNTLREYLHVDYAGRIYNGPEDERYINVGDARLETLYVQCTPNIWKHAESGTSSWSRVPLKNNAPRGIRIAVWPTEDLPPNTKDWTFVNWMGASFRWIISSFVMMVFYLVAVYVLAKGFFLGDPQDGDFKNDGNYDSFAFRNLRYAKHARNKFEENPKKKQLISSSQNSEKIRDIDKQKSGYRLLRPSRLCFPTSGNVESPIEVMTDDEWAKKHPENPFPKYLFISYMISQFPSDDDKDVLYDIACRAAREAGVPAFWLGHSCLVPQGLSVEEESRELEDGVYKISDVVRGAQSVVVILGRPGGVNAPFETTLKEWGSRLWTFPEVLLCPSDDIKVYQRVGNKGIPRNLVSKNDFTYQAWEDYENSRQLVDHYNGSLLLSRLELIQVALECLHWRKTEKYLRGDTSYALMGLLRQRPNIDPSDNEFQAFAQLSLANDSDRLLERLACMIPPEGDNALVSMKDGWGVSLWDVEPTCQIAGVGHGDTIIVDGCRAASIAWNHLTPVKTSVSSHSFRRLLASMFLSALAIEVIFGASFLYYLDSQYLGTTRSERLGFGVTLTVLFVLQALLMPRIWRTLYSGKYWKTEAWLYGIEGYVSPSDLEKYLFGWKNNRLSWSAAGSTLSRHEGIVHSENYVECVGQDPRYHPDTSELVERYIRDGPTIPFGEKKLFTIVDTNAMTVSLITATRPPSVLLIMGSEGGMQRAALCSYDWKSQTLYRESVMRVDTISLSKMGRVGKVTFGFKRPETIFGDV